MRQPETNSKSYLSGILVFALSLHSIWRHDSSNGSEPTCDRLYQKHIISKRRAVTLHAGFHWALSLLSVYVMICRCNMKICYMCANNNHILVFPSERRLAHAQAGVLSHVHIWRKLVSVRNSATGRQNNSETGKDELLFWQDRMTLFSALMEKLIKKRVIMTLFLLCNTKTFCCCLQ